jgi:DNA polymerase III subunit epsilon
MFSYPVPQGRHAHGTHGYAVVDLETTGFDARRTDRIVEIAIVRMDATGHELGRFETLVDPGRSTGPSSVHHITEAMVCGAPTFAQCAPSVLAWLEGAVVVAHNARFEDAFLTAEFARAGCSPPPMPALDTLPMAQWCVPTPNHRLATVCRWAGVSIHGAHTAMGDAQATAQMLPRLLRQAGGVPAWSVGLPDLAGHLGGPCRPRWGSRPLATASPSARRGTTLEAAG